MMLVVTHKYPIFVISKASENPTGNPFPKPPSLTKKHLKTKT
jgi:hypothetical protein